MPESIHGTFVVDTSTWMKRLLQIFEEMVQGKWAWSTDGDTFNAFIVFQEDYMCHFTDLNER